MISKVYSISGILILLFTAVLLMSCNSKLNSTQDNHIDYNFISGGSDRADFKVWNHPTHADENLIIKINQDNKGGFYVYNTAGQLVNKHLGLQGISSIAVAYGLEINGKKVDVVVASESNRDRIRVFRMPDLVPIDVRGIKVMENFSQKGWHDLELVNLQTENQTNGNKKIYAIVDSKDDTETIYRVQYELIDNGRGSVDAKLIHKANKKDFVVYTETEVVDNYLVSLQSE